MADKYSTIQQRQPLRVPDGWTGTEKSLVIQIDQIFDDIYRRYGRLRLEDMEQSFRKQIADDEGNIAQLMVDVGEITIEVGNKYDKISGIAITEDGIDVSGNKYVRIRSGGTFDVDATNFKISSAEKKLVAGNWTLDDGGLIYANPNDAVKFEIADSRNRDLDAMGIYYEYSVEDNTSIGTVSIRPAYVDGNGNLVHGIFYFKAQLVDGVENKFFIPYVGADAMKAHIGSAQRPFDTAAITDIYGTLHGDMIGNLDGNIVKTSGLFDVYPNGTSGKRLEVLGINVGGTDRVQLQSDGELWIKDVHFNNAATGNLVGNVTGNVTGNVSGNVSGDVTGSLNGNILKSSGVVDIIPEGTSHKKLTIMTLTVGGTERVQLQSDGEFYLKNVKFNGAATGNLTGNVTGNLTGNVTGDVLGNVTGDLTGNVVKSSGVFYVYPSGTSNCNFHITRFVLNSKEYIQLVSNADVFEFKGNADTATKLSRAPTYGELSGR